MRHMRQERILSHNLSPKVLDRNECSQVCHVTNIDIDIDGEKKFDASCRGRVSFTGHTKPGGTAGLPSQIGNFSVLWAGDVAM